MNKKPYYAHKFDPGYINHFLDVKDAKVLDSMVGIVKRSKSLVLFLGDRSLAKHYIKKHFKQAKIMRMREFERTGGYDDYKRVAVIDIDKNYKLERL